MSFQYLQGQSTFSIHNTVGQDDSRRMIYCFHTKLVIFVSTSTNLRIYDSSHMQFIGKTMFRIVDDWRNYVTKSLNHYDIRYTSICRSGYTFHQILVDLNFRVLDYVIFHISSFNHRANRHEIMEIISLPEQLVACRADRYRLANMLLHNRLSHKRAF